MWWCPTGVCERGGEYLNTSPPRASNPFRPHSHLFTIPPPSLTSHGCNPHHLLTIPPHHHHRRRLPGTCR